LTHAAAYAVLIALYPDQQSRLDAALASSLAGIAEGATRKWTRIQDYIDEVSLARIYAGFHYRFSTTAGEDMGRKIAELAVTTKLLGVKTPRAEDLRD
jgi:hypothetical protein